MPAVLGISALYHDAAAALVVDGEIVAAAQEERFTRRKHDSAWPRQAISYCLDEAGLTADQLDLVGYYEKPLRKFDRLIETHLKHAPTGYRTFARAMPTWLKERPFIRRRIRELLPSYTNRIAFLEHHESHAASAYYPSPFDEAAILTLDGVGEWACGSIGTGTGSTVRLIQTTSFPHSVGLLYSAFTAFCGFRVNDGEYKLMGLAPYGQPNFVDVITDRLVRVQADGSIELDLTYFGFAVGTQMTNRRFAQLFGGAARRPESEITQREMDLAASVQVVLEDIVLKSAAHAQSITGLTNLCLAGGVALNCVANGKLLDKEICDDIWIQPAGGDAGGALGVAIALTHMALGVPRPAFRSNQWNSSIETSGRADRQRGSLLGPSFSNDDIADRLDTLGAKYERVGNDLDSIVARQLDDGKVIGWFQGRMEYGPRALGNRSILGDARHSEMQRIINLKVKFRESFRPFAPAVLAEYAGRLFNIPSQSRFPHRYMLATVDVANEQLRSVDQLAATSGGLGQIHSVRSTIPAVTHVDNSARIQLVTDADQPRFRQLIHAFHELTECPAVINTSFNVRDEPIVCTPEDAYRCFMASGIDVLAIGDCLLLKSEQPPNTRPSATPTRDPIKAFSNLELRVFAIGQAIFVTLLIWLVLGRPTQVPNWFLFLATALAAIGLAGVVCPRWIGPYRRLWGALLTPLEWVISRTLLAIVYFGVLTTTGLIWRCVRRPTGQSTGWNRHLTPSCPNRLWRLW